MCVVGQRSHGEGLDEGTGGIEQKQKYLMDMDNSAMIARGMVVEEDMGVINLNKKRLDLMWSIHNSMYRWCVVGLCIILLISVTQII